ncbi:hypothetical protein EI982_14395 [Haloplanus rallus]|uniref:Uncharacterized protein n=1 Tax=Haloplanus rallus TaxID=1816183 RepID=A0A6B9FAV1_9EURY|nr:MULTISPECIES: hypothetical protein [Haloplanus]QGX95887.1 hypothetical protein EI982_14395 [Haloplanus rallus]
MGLRCLLGHEYANREVEREREERGDEVVVTYRTVETCERCGERRIVSENKEVRPVRDPTEEGVTTGLGGGVTPDLDADDAEAEATTDAETPATGGKPADDGAEVDPDSGSEPAVEADVDPVSAHESETAEADPSPAHDPATAEADTDPSPSAEEDDAVILDDDGPSVDREPGEWPGADDTTADTADDAEETAAVPEADDGTTVVEGEGWPDPEGEDEGFDAAPGDAAPDDVALDEEVGPAVGDGTAANGTTEAAGGAAGKQFVAAQEVEPVGDDRTTAAETEFFCPNCGHARGAGGSSMRAGDICPECHQGYIAERER